MSSLSMSSLSCHILDTTHGLPANNVEVELHSFNQAPSQSDCIAKGVTNGDGRYRFEEVELPPASYTLKFLVADYCQQKFGSAFFPLVEIHFNVEDGQQHYHIPLLLSPYSYSTYRGS